MNISVLVEGTERKNFIEWASFDKKDVITSQVDTLRFRVKKWGSKTWKPAVSDEIIVYDGSNKIFGGTIVKVDETIKGSQVLEYQVYCKDYTHLMDRKDVVESYEKKTIAQIITDLKDNWMPSGFSVSNVNCDLDIDYIAFNYEQPSKCLQQLANLVNYYWYVDYDKDIHFFPKTGELAPFGLSDTNGKYIFNSLKISEDLRQLKNYVFVRGGEYQATQRSEKYDADGEQDSFNLAYKYKSTPGVDIDGSQKTVGVDGLNTFTDYYCLWSYNEKYVRFENPIGVGEVITISGKPLFPVLCRARDEESIALYGESHHKIIDKSIKTKVAARDRAKAELRAYALPLKVGRFQTYTSGLRSGHLINVNSTIRSLDENFLIQSVSLKMLGANKGIWNVEIVSIKTEGIIEFLQNLVLKDDKNIEIKANEILEVLENIEEGVVITELITRHTEKVVHETCQFAEQIRRDPWVVEWILAPHFPDDDNDLRREGLLDISFYLY